jgi:hypothetical protein
MPLCVLDPAEFLNAMPNRRLLSNTSPTCQIDLERSQIRLELDRFPKPHLVFSSGIHFCLDMQLARIEIQSALAQLYDPYPDLALAEPGSDGSSALA